MVAPAPQPTAEQLIETLAEAGEVDVGVDVLDAVRMRDPTASLVRLQARLFDAPDALPLDVKRAALAPWADGAFERLMQRGALFEAAAGLRVMAQVFADDPAWAERHARAETLAAPLPNPHGDPKRSAFDAALARGDVADAWERLRALVRHEPADHALALRLEALRDVVFPPAETRPYEALRELPDASTMADLAARIPSRLASGDLQGALLDAATLAEQPGANPRWARFRDALQRLVAWSSSVAAPVTDDEVTTRTGPIERVELWLRAGNLQQARDALRQQIGVSPPALAAQLAVRLADLDAVLDTTLPTPVPARPSSQSHVAISVARAAPPPHFAGTEDTEPARPHLAPMSPPPSSPDALARPSAPDAPSQPPASPSQPPETPSMIPPPTGDVKVGKRKIVRLK